MTQDAFFTPLSLDWESFVFSYRLPRPSAVEVRSVSPDGTVRARTAEENMLGRLGVQGLSPATAYEFEVQWDGGRARLPFETLPAPVGPLRSHFIAMADPHVSLKAENRKGRLFVESASVLRDLVEDFNAMGVDGVLVSGDLTNAGTPAEFSRVKDIFSSLRCPLYAAPGDHDIHGGDDTAWSAVFGAPARLAEMKGLCVVLLDASSGRLGPDGRALLERALEADVRGRIVVAHPQLVPDAYIRFGKHKGIQDEGEHRDLLERLCGPPTLIYAGHQNAPSRVGKGGRMQLNLPQPVQYPCGCIRVREYANGFYHTYLPIRSEALNEYSRQACQAAVTHYNEPQWDEAYRRGAGFDHLNFLFVPKPEGEGSA